MSVVLERDVCYRAVTSVGVQLSPNPSLSEQNTIYREQSEKMHSEYAAFDILVNGLYRGMLVQERVDSESIDNITHQLLGGVLSGKMNRHQMEDFIRNTCQNAPRVFLDIEEDLSITGAVGLSVLSNPKSTLDSEKALALVHEDPVAEKIFYTSPTIFTSNTSITAA